MPFGPVIIDIDIFNAISDEEKTKIEGILKNTTLLAEDGKLEGEAGLMANAQSAIADPQWGLPGWIPNIGQETCKIGCDVVASAAAAACTSGAGLVACLAAAQAARNACRSAC